MPGSAQSAALTDGYRARLAELRRRALLVVTAAWVLDGARLDDTFLEWLARADRILTAMQETSARLSIVYLAAYVGSELGEPPAPASVDPADHASVTVDGRPLRAVLLPALFTVRAVLAAGRTFAEASDAGRARALRNATVELTAAADGALDAAIEAEPRVGGWRRVTSARPCGACLGAATGRVEPPSAPLLRHPHCACTKEPVVDGVTERVRRPTGAELFRRMPADEQDRLFDGRGGKAKADLVRSGTVSLGALVSHDPQVAAGRPPILTETPLARLR